MSRRLVASAAAALVLGGCALLEPPTAAIPMPALPGWAAEDHAAAFALVRETCAASQSRSGPCRSALAEGPLGETGAREYLEANFEARPVAGEGLLTAYYAPDFEARRSPGGDFTAPLRPPPPPGTPPQARLAIEASPAPDALGWMRPEDLFALQTQGSGRLVFADGARLRALFAGSNGLPYAGIGRTMVQQGLLEPGEASADRVQAWLAAHRGPAADAVMGLDPRYIYFRLARDDGSPVRGAAGQPLVPGRSVAVDPAAHRWFELLWIDATGPALPGARPAWRGLAAALDTGAAIRGPARADLYLGEGAAAGEAAARVSHRLRLYVVSPVGGDAR